MTLIESLKITHGGIKVIVRIRIYGMEASFSGYPSTIIENGQSELLNFSVQQLAPQENTLVFYL